MLPAFSNGSDFTAAWRFAILRFVLITATMSWFTLAQASEIQGVAQARGNVQANKLILIDIRRPDEWAASGIGDVAVALDMREPNFLAQVRELQLAAPDKRLGFICATGVRSRRLTSWFVRNGISDVVDVSEGMHGRNGWLANQLPVRQPPALNNSSR